MALDVGLDPRILLHSTDEIEQMALLEIVKKAQELKHKRDSAMVEAIGNSVANEVVRRFKK